MRSLISPKTNKPKLEQSQRAKVAPPVPILCLVALIGLALAVAVPRFAHMTNTSKQAINPSAIASTAVMQNNKASDRLQVFWSNAVSQAQFWLDNTPVTTTNCNQHNCTVPKPQNTGQIYFRWLDTTDNKWYYFQCNGDYKGQFQGVPLHS
jgi:hypothetical protein